MTLNNHQRLAMQLLGFRPLGLYPERNLVAYLRRACPSAYHSKALKAQAEASGLQFNVNQRGSRNRPLTKAQRARNRRLSRVRATVEHPFLVVKHLWGHAKVRYRGIKKNLAQMYMLFALANVFRVRRQLMSA